jgi:hypothetical protein
MKEQIGSSSIKYRIFLILLGQICLMILKVISRKDDTRCNTSTGSATAQHKRFPVYLFLEIA